MNSILNFVSISPKENDKDELDLTETPDHFDPIKLSRKIILRFSVISISN